jgi:NAD(P)-dependent dehydrogenase (short-subunit alcohol dehydrogenase family)
MSAMAGKTALVTGGGSGIGLAVARAFLGAGARVAIAGRHADKLRRAADVLQGGDRLVYHTADVSVPEQAEELVRDVVGRFGHLDVLVNNAGANIKERTFAELTPESWQQLIGANLHGAFYCMKAALPHMRQRKGGLVININSIAGRRANPLGGTGYNAAKFGLRGLAMSVAAEEREHGVRVSSVYPGEVETPILEHRPTPLGEEHRRTILQPEDVAAAVLMIASLPPRATVPELVITPTKAQFV